MPSAGSPGGIFDSVFDSFGESTCLVGQSLGSARFARFSGLPYRRWRSAGFTRFGRLLYRGWRSAGLSRFGRFLYWAWGDHLRVVSVAGDLAAKQALPATLVAKIIPYRKSY